MGGRCLPKPTTDEFGTGGYSDALPRSWELGGEVISHHHGIEFRSSKSLLVCYLFTFLKFFVFYFNGLFHHSVLFNYPHVKLMNVFYLAIFVILQHLNWNMFPFDTC